MHTHMPVYTRTHTHTNKFKPHAHTNRHTQACDVLRHILYMEEKDKAI